MLYVVNIMHEENSALLPSVPKCICKLEAQMTLESTGLVGETTIPDEIFVDVVIILWKRAL